MKKLCWVTALAVTVMSVSAAWATPFETQSQTLSFGFPLSPGSDTLSFDQFCPDFACDRGGTAELKMVELELNVTAQADMTAENDSAIPGNVAVSFTANVDGAGAGLSTTVGLNRDAGPVPLEASDGVPEAGADYHDFGTLEDSDTDSDLLVDGINDLTPFIGCETIDIQINGVGGFAYQGDVDVTLRVANFGAAGDATITYYYDCVPEPMTMSLLALGGLALLRRRV